jgi:hypothetical protein
MKNLESRPYECGVEGSRRISVGQPPAQWPLAESAGRIRENVQFELANRVVVQLGCERLVAKPKALNATVTVGVCRAQGLKKRGLPVEGRDHQGIQRRRRLLVI